MYKPQFQKHEVLVFRHFQRKGYSLFACLGREVVISVLSAATLSSAKAASISDEVWRVDSAGHQLKEVMLADVGVTGSRAPLTRSQAARMVTVLSREDIQAAPVQSINDLLKMAAGVDVRQRGPLGSQADVSIRGGTQEQIVVMLNGISICDPQTAHNAINLPCQLSDIVRIEVLEGPAGRAYGTSSLVGAVNIVTQGHAGQPSEVSVEGGSFGYLKTGVTADLTPLHPQWKRLRSRLSAGYQRSDGYSHTRSGTHNTDFSGAKAFWQGAYDDETVCLDWCLGLSDKGWGSSTFYASPRWQADDQYEHTTKTLAALQAETRQGALRLQAAVYWQLHQDRYEGYRGRPDLMPYNYNRCSVSGVKANAYFDSPLGRTAFGAELRNEDLLSGNLGEPLSRPHHIAGTDRDYTLGINRTNITAHLEHNVLLRRLTVSAGFVAAKSSWSAMNMTLYPGIDASLRLGRHWKLFAGWNSSLRLPSFTEMYYRLQGYAADPHLKPEEMQALEAGAELHTPTLQAKAAVWRHHGRNMIDWVMDTRMGDEAQWQSVNHTRINATGLELSASLRLQTVTASLAYSLTDQDKDAGKGIVSQYALEYLRHKLTATLQAPLWRRLSLRIDARWQDRAGSYTDFQGVVCDYRPFFLADARLQWTAPRCTLFAECCNLLDNRHYVDYGNVPQPGRWAVTGINYRF